MHRYIQFLFTQLEDIKEELHRANATIAENASEQKRLNALVLSLTNQLNDALKPIGNYPVSWRIRNPLLACPRSTVGYNVFMYLDNELYDIEHLCV